MKINKNFFNLFLLSLISFCSGALIGGKINSQTNYYKWKTVIISTPIFDKYFKNKEIQSTFKSSFATVECPNDYLGIVGFGQSNIANRVIRNELIKSMPNVYMWDWTNGKCYPYSEPLVGTDGANKGNVLSDTVYSLRENGIDRTILIASMARGNSSVFFWYKGPQKYRLEEFLKKSKKFNLNFRYWVWLQGETDAKAEFYLPFKNMAFGNKKGEINAFYQRALNSVFNKVKSEFPSALFGVSITSKCQNTGNVYIRLAQNNIIKERLDTYLTIDTDNLGNKYRSDGCHFNAGGSKIIGKAISDFVLQNEKIGNN